MAISILLGLRIDGLLSLSSFPLFCLLSPIPLIVLPGCVSLPKTRNRETAGNNKRKGEEEKHGNDKKSQATSRQAGTTSLGKSSESRESSELSDPSAWRFAPQPSRCGPGFLPRKFRKRAIDDSIQVNAGITRKIHTYLYGALNKTSPPATIGSLVLRPSSLLFAVVL